MHKHIWRGIITIPPKFSVNWKTIQLNGIRKLMIPAAWSNFFSLLYFIVPFHWYWEIVLFLILGRLSFQSSYRSRRLRRERGINRRCLPRKSTFQLKLSLRVIYRFYPVFALRYNLPPYTRFLFLNGICLSPAKEIYFPKREISDPIQSWKVKLHNDRARDS